MNRPNISKLYLCDAARIVRVQDNCFLNSAGILIYHSGFSRHINQAISNL